MKPFGIAEQALLWQALIVTKIESFDVCVIGSGIAGLTAAALLQHDGARVLLLEAHDKPGGCAGYFSLGAFTFSAGATVALGLEANGLHRRVFEQLGVRDYQAHQLPGLRVLLPEREVIVWHDAARWKQARRALPGHRTGQELFWKLQEILADCGWRALEKWPSLPLQTSRDWRRNLALADPRLLPMLPFLGCTVGDALRVLKIADDRDFVALLNLLLIITTQSEAGESPLTNGCSGLDLFRHGAYHLPGGMGTIAKLLCEAFVRDGGTAHFGEHVTHVVPERGAFHISSENTHYRAAKVVANVPLPNVAKLAKLPPRAQRNLDANLQRSPPAWGAVTLYAAVREDVLPRDGGQVWQHQQVLLDYAARPGDGRDVFVSLSRPGDLLQAPRGWRALTASTHTRLAEWDDLSPQQYRERKREWREKLLSGVRRLLPDFDAGRKFVVVGTPRTWQSYTQRQRGNVGGVPTTLANANLRALPQRLGLRDFWVVGDWTFPGQGTVACALSGINVWREISGK